MVTMTLSFFFLHMWEKLDVLLLAWWDIGPVGGFQVEVLSPRVGGRVAVLDSLRVEALAMVLAPQGRVAARLLPSMLLLFSC